VENARKKALEQFAKDVEQGLPFAEDYIQKDSNVERNALRARAFTEEALANQVLKNTGIPIPGKEASPSKQADFLARIMKERYPELEPDVRVLPDKKIKNMLDESVSGFYQPEVQSRQNPLIVVNENELLKGGPTRGVGTLLHEAGHQYDDRILKKATEELDLETLRKLVREGYDLKNMDPAQVYELYGAKHHAQIPSLREGTFGLGALKSYLKTGNFKGTTGPAGAVLESMKGLYTDAPVKANPGAQAKIASAYEAMKHDPSNPEVQKAYQALMDETEQQFEDLQKNKGLKLSKIGEDYPNPYKSSADLIKDVRENKHMAYFPTDDGFGAGGAADAAQSNPLLKETRFVGPDGKPMKANDLFRVVHDYYGHVAGDNKFGATGEERAYQAHRKMFSPEAQKALATETRGQNSWVNFGPFGEANRANPAETKYAEQKTGLLPQWATEDLEKIENPKMYRAHGVATAAARALGPLAIASGVVPLAADIKEGKTNTALARAASYAAPIGAEDITANLMEEAALRDKSPELFDPEYRKLLQRIGQKRMEQGKSPVVESFSGQPVDTSATEGSDVENRIKALQALKSQG
jgi:hypothetical protein